MTTSFNRLFLATFLLSAATCQAHAQVLNAAGAIMRGKSILEFYEAAIANPQQVLLLSVEIRSRFTGDSTRYKHLSNELAQSLGLFDAGPLGLDHIELGSEPSPSSEHGYYSIKLKKLNFKQCTALANHTPLNQNFVRVELNGVPVIANGATQQTLAVCRSQWFFQSGRNELKYVAY